MSQGPNLDRAIEGRCCNPRRQTASRAEDIGDREMVVGPRVPRRRVVSGFIIK